MATKRQIELKCNEILQNVNAIMKGKLQTALRSRAIDIEGAEDNYILPKIIIYAILLEMEWASRPPRKSWEKEAKNLAIQL